MRIMYLADIIPDATGYMPSQEELIAFGMSGTPQFQTPIHSPARAWDFWSTPFIDAYQPSILDGSFATIAADTIPDQAPDQDVEMQHQDSVSDGPAESSEVPTPSDFNVPPPINNVERIWFTKFRADEDSRRLSTIAIGHSTPSVTQCSEVTDVDDQYRLQLTKAVHNPQPSDDPLPASDFLVP